MTIRLGAAALALVVLGVALLAGVGYAGGVERRFIHALAPLAFPQKDQGSVLQVEAFRQSDLLPIYGSSELNIGNPYHANTVFKQYPTGFTIFPVGKAGTTDLVMLQDLAAVGRDLAGKKVVISLSAPWFFGAMVGQDAYAGNFSALHAGELAFSTVLSLPVKQAAARRMLEYPRTLEQEPVLRFALNQLASGTPAAMAKYYAVFPLGKLRNLVLRLQDHAAVLLHIRRQTKLDPAPRRVPGLLDWSKLERQADREQYGQANNNDWGFDNAAFLKKYALTIGKEQNTRNDKTFLKNLGASKEWGDLATLLRGLRDMGAQPLILSMPIQGTYYSYTGVTPQARSAYYERLRKTVEPYGVPLLDFADHDQDKLFLIDPGAHLSRKGWVYYDQALEAFYHGTLK